MEIKKLLKITSIIQVVLLVFSIIFFFYGLPVSIEAGKMRDYEKAAEDFEVEVTGKTNGNSTYYDYVCNLSCTVKNNSDEEAYTVSGTLTIKDKEGNVLSSGIAEFRTTFEPESEKAFTLRWSMDKTENAAKILEADYSQLIFSFEIEEITFDGYNTITLGE